MDMVTYALCKKLIANVASGITDIEIQGTTMTITDANGQEHIMVFPTPKDGVSIIDVEIDMDNNLICHLSDGSVVDAGPVPAMKGEPGETPVKGVDYFTEAEIEQIKEEIKAEVEQSYELQII